MCIGVLFTYSSTLDTDSMSNYLSEEDCLLLDSLFTISNDLEPTNKDTVCNIIRRRQQAQSAVEFSYQTKYYITSNPTIASGMGRILVICDNATYNSLSNENGVYLLVTQIDGKNSIDKFANF